MFRYVNYQQQAYELAEVCVELLKALDALKVDNAYVEILCRKLYKYGYINMKDDEYILKFISNPRRNARERES